MEIAATPIKIILRIPGQWSGPKELMERVPKEIRFWERGIVLPDDTRFELDGMDADDQFAQVFRGSCRQPATADELATIDNYKVNMLLSGPGGSRESAHKMMQAGAAIVRAGGAGVFIDNSALAHGGANWLAMTEDGGPDALSFAFVSIVRGDHEAWTMGMHTLGLRDILMKRTDAESDEFGIIDVIRYMAANDKPIGDGHLLADLNGPRFRTIAQPSAGLPPGSPMHNPFGRLKLVSMRDAAEMN